MKKLINLKKGLVILLCQGISFYTYSAFSVPIVFCNNVNKTDYYGNTYHPNNELFHDAYSYKKGNIYHSNKELFYDAYSYMKGNIYHPNGELFYDAYSYKKGNIYHPDGSLLFDNYSIRKGSVYYPSGSSSELGQVLKENYSIKNGSFYYSSGKILKDSSSGKCYFENKVKMTNCPVMSTYTWKYLVNDFEVYVTIDLNTLKITNYRVRATYGNAVSDYTLSNDNKYFDVTAKCSTNLAEGEGFGFENTLSQSPVSYSSSSNSFTVDGLIYQNKKYLVKFFNQGNFIFNLKKVVEL